MASSFGVGLAEVRALLTGEGGGVGADVTVMVLNSPDISALLGRALGAADRVYCVDGGGNRLLAKLRTGEVPADALRGPRWLIGDFDSLRPDARTELEERYGFQAQHIVDDYCTDFEKALNHCHPRLPAGKRHILLVDGAFGGRFDQTVAALSAALKALARWNAVFLLGNETLVAPLPPGRAIVDVPLDAAGAVCAPFTKVCGLLPIVEPVRLSMTGFRWNLTDETLAMTSFVSSSNEIADAQLTVDSSAPLYFYVQWQ